MTVISIESATTIPTKATPANKNMFEPFSRSLKIQTT
jgi:hypothetical protein